MSKILSPKAWYLVAIGAAALAADGARRIIKKRRAEARHTAEAAVETDIPVTSFEPTRTAPVKEAPAAPEPKAKTAAAKADDLTEINGIGPTFAKRLAEAGVTTFAALAASTPEHLHEVTHATAVAKPEEWIAQARLK